MDKNENNKLRLEIMPERVEAQAFKLGIEDFFELLDDVTKNYYRDKESPKWYISVETGSNIITAYPENNSLVVDNAHEFLGIIKNGFDLLEQKPQRPPYFSDNALLVARRLSNRFYDKKKKTSQASICVFDRRIPLSATISANINNILKGMFSDYGTVEGKLVTISSKNGFYCAIFDRLLNRNIKCSFNERQIEEIKDGFNKRVSVSGMINYDRDGNPNRVKVEDFIIFPEKRELPSYKDVRGILRD